MTSEQNIPVTRKLIKSEAKAMLSNRELLLKLIFCGFLYIAVTILFEVFSNYAYSAVFSKVTENPKNSLVFDLFCQVLNIILIFPLFLGLWLVAAKLANQKSTESVEIFTYYSSFKRLKRAWAVGAIIRLPLTLISLIQNVFSLFASKALLIKAFLPFLNFGLNIVYFIVIIFILGRLFPFINSVVCGGDQPVSLCLKASLKSTKGKLWKLLGFYLSFIPWILLSLLTVGVLFIIFTFPYMLIAECIYSKYLLTGKYRDHITEETL